MTFTLDQIIALSPDEASTKAAKGLLAPAKWPTLGLNEAAIWGECQGSGSKPYQTQVDRNGPAFRCSCPSRKFPCKHGLALLMLSVQQGDKFAADAASPAWVAEWLASRGERAAKQEARAQARQDEAQQPVDPEAQAKREAKRFDRIEAGVEELERWLHDQVRHGLARLETAGADTWRTLAARMVDAQASGLAIRVNELAQALSLKGDWPPRLLARMGRLQLLLDASRRLPALSAAQQADVRTALGLAPGKEEVLAQGEQVNDRWAVVAVSTIERDKLWERRVWLWGLASGRRALLLDFAHATPRFADSWMSGVTVSATLAFYPGALPSRALLLAPPARVDAAVPDFPPLPEALPALATQIAANPWQGVQPMAVAAVTPGRAEKAWHAHAADGSALPLRISDPDAWRLLAITGGKPCALFGEWDGDCLEPLSAWGERQLWTPGAHV